ncbi:threonine/serine exporter family protein [Moritella sp.]|uniref:threonine/serine exporter family protein n=1 Tax=Moritella sp. TaxID=78556 RepID=UPI001E03CC49|nr:threonine/serine exporter family protein [Moritella sp.]MCJ8351082.1 threonine/serine exporter family protein [Moritella sp.]NQZ41630.1 threonine/serine exporter family protein [Moritella sp.]
MSELLLMLVDDAVFAGIAAFGFALLFNVPRQALVACVLFAASAHAVRSLLLHVNVPIEWASFIAATLLGLATVPWSRKVVIPRPVVTVAAIIPMIPGVYAYKTMTGLMTLHHQGYNAVLQQQIVENGLLTIFILIGLSFGLAIAPVLVYRNKPIV